MTVPGHDRIPELLAEGRELLDRSRYPEAVDVFGRILLLDPGNEGAQAGLGACRLSAAEAHRRLDAALDEARLAIHAGDVARARPLLERVVAEGGDRDIARALLDRLDRRDGRLFGGAPSAREVEQGSAPLPRARVRWSRRALVMAWVACFAVLTAGVASSWERMVRGLVEPPAPAPAVGVPVTEPRAQSSGERAVLEARRLADGGDVAGALAVLDRVAPDEPAYPFARQLRSQVEAAVRQGAKAP